MGQSSGIGVLDKAVQVLRATTASPSGLAELCAATGLPRATAHRLAVGLEVHGLLARDAELMVHEAGYRCVAAGAVNMFPHTAHVESIAVFEKAVDPKPAG